MALLLPALQLQLRVIITYGNRLISVAEQQLLLHLTRQASYLASGTGKQYHKNANNHVQMHLPGGRIVDN